MARDPRTVHPRKDELAQSVRADAGHAVLVDPPPGRAVMTDGNTAVSSVAYRMSEIIALFPITPASPMGEHADAWATAGRPNLWGEPPRVVAMQSEAGAAGAVHGALQAGALATTFTASQGLLLMIPEMYKIAGELTAFCMHVAARSLATHALSIFCDHSDVMAVRGTGFALLSSASVQEAQDFAAIAHAATLRARVPFLHFMDGFRTSHEVSKVLALEDATLRALLDEDDVATHRRRALDPDHPVIRGTAHNPDTFFQAREAAEPYYAACAEIVRETMARFAALTGRAYAPFEYVGHPEAERVLVLMGSACETAEETVRWMVERGERVGAIKVRLYRPFDGDALLAALPPTTRAVAALDRTKEPGSEGEPLYLDVTSALARRGRGDVRVVGGRYGLSSKELTPAMLAAVFRELASPAPRTGFTLGIVDDVSGSSLTWDRRLDIEEEEVLRAVFYGIGSDGTVGAKKQAITIVGEGTDRFAQGTFVYDSKKSGTMTISYLRVSPRPIRSAYRLREASFVACSAPELLARRDILGIAARGATVLLNLPADADAWALLPREAQDAIVDKELRVFVVDATGIAAEAGLEGRVGTVMQTGFFALTDLLPAAEALGRVREAVAQAYARRGEEVVAKNLAIIDRAATEIRPLRAREGAARSPARPAPVPEDAPDFVRRVTARMLAGEGDELPVSAFPPDGTWPVGTAAWEKRRLAKQVPVWEVTGCIQCNKCVLACPHAALRAKLVPAGALGESARAMEYKGKEVGLSPDGRRFHYALAVSPDDCTGCELCALACPVEDGREPGRRPLVMGEVAAVREAEQAAFDALAAAPTAARARVRLDVKGSQLLEPLFAFPGACSGCGQTPYLKLLSQLFGDRALIANATGCSSIYGGNLPTTPWTTDADGRGPAWSNSLFEDDAEFGLGLRLGLDARRREAARLLRVLAPVVGDELTAALLGPEARDEAGIAAQRERVALLRERLCRSDHPAAPRLDALADALVRRSVWIVGGDGWAYDIGYGGLDHVLASGADVNILVLDTEVYSNTGGQRSKATPLGAVAKFAAGGKETPKKDLGLMAMTYGSAYVASVALGAKDAHAVKAFVEAETYDGPSLVLAYSPCIEHGYDLAHGPDQERLAFASGVWPLYRFDPRREDAGLPALQLETPAHPEDVERYLRGEGRFLEIERRDPAAFAALTEALRRQVTRRRALYERLSR